MHEIAALHPRDGYNRALESNVRPRDWINPKPTGRYNLVVIGAGTAGLVTAAGAAGLGAKVALIERGLLGGDCLNGMRPFKRAAWRGETCCCGAESGGIRRQAEASVDFAAVMERMRRLRAGISAHDSATRFRELGVDVFLGQGTFTVRTGSMSPVRRWNSAGCHRDRRALPCRRFQAWTKSNFSPMNPFSR
jgi:glycine/D-amino acid oxidase-like deaminating enzyme